MTKPTLIALSSNLADRAQTIIEDGHSAYAIMKDAFGEVKRMGGMAGAMSVMQTGKLNQAQLDAAERIVVKMLAVLELHGAGKSKIKPAHTEETND